MLIIGACLLGLMQPTTALAAKADGKKAKLIAKYDKNKNGVIDGEEMKAFRKDFAADKEGTLKGYDKDGDGKLSDEEIKAIKPGAGKKAKGQKGSGKGGKKEGQKGKKSEDEKKGEGGEVENSKTPESPKKSAKSGGPE